jgi:3-oxoacyl-[acyl-carrier-protein] synthase III
VTATETVNSASSARHFVPERVVTNADLTRVMDTSDE